MLAGASAPRAAVWRSGARAARRARRCTRSDPRSSLAPLSEAARLRPPAWEVRVYGSDISRRCVAAARRGVYGASSFRVDAARIRGARSSTSARTGGTSPRRIRQMCHFGQMNLLDEERARVLGRVDVIFCRNVLIYFDARARESASSTCFYERLNPGGVLLLGHSESLLERVDGVRAVTLEGRPRVPKAALVRAAERTTSRTIQRELASVPPLHAPSGCSSSMTPRTTAGTSPTCSRVSPTSRSSARPPTAKRRCGSRRSSSPTSSRSTSRCRAWTASRSCAS